MGRAHAGGGSTAGGADLMALAFMPKPIRELPWITLALVIAIVVFDVLVLYSAAGGKLTWALPQAVRFVVFLGMAIALSWVRLEWVKQAVFRGLNL